MSDIKAGVCGRAKCGEYNMLRCCAPKGHAGECCFVVDHANDYPWNAIERLRAQESKT